MSGKLGLADRFRALTPEQKESFWAEYNALEGVGPMAREWIQSWRLTMPPDQIPSQTENYVTAEALSNQSLCYFNCA